MNNKLSGILTIIASLIGVITFYFFIRIVMVGDDALETDADLQASIVSPFITFAKIVLIATAGIAVVFSALNLIKHPGVLKRSLMAVGILLVLLAGAYSFASDAAVTDGVGKILEDGQAGSVSKWVGTLINYSYILGAIGLVLVGIDFVKGLVK